MAIFSPQSNLVGQSNASLRVVALTMLVAIPGKLWLTAVIGTGDTLASLCIEALLTLTMLGLTYLAAIQFAWPMSVVWVSWPLTWLVGLALSYGWMKSRIWRRVEV